MTNPPPVPDRSHLMTEAVNESTRGLDSLPTDQALRVMQAEDARIHEALAGARPELAAAIDAIAARLTRGGRLFYVGAGTSGRLGVLDAVECPPTFQSDPDLVQGILAGGTGAMFLSVEGAEDSTGSAAEELASRNCGSADVVFGISAGGTTPFVHGAIAFAGEVGALSIFFACVSRQEVEDQADISIRVPTGPEVLQGSTRLKAGTATKLALNSISTLVMAKLGKLYDNRMVDVKTAGNVKLLDRGIRLVSELAGVDRDTARAALESAGGHAKSAILMLRADLAHPAALERLEACGGSLRLALGETGP